MSGFLLLVTITPSVADNNLANVPPDIKQLGMWLEERPEPVYAPTALYNLQDNGTKVTLCNGFQDPFCSSAEVLYLIANFDICSSNSKTNCISDIWATDSKGQRKSGEFIKYIPGDSTQYLEGIPEKNIPDSHGIGSIWRIPGLENASDQNLFFIETRATLFKSKDKKSFDYGEINSSVTPVQTVSGSYGLPVLEKNGGFRGGQFSSIAASDCLATDPQTCYRYRPFPADYRFGLTLRLGENLLGWFHGRFHEPSISIIKRDVGQEISIEADPIIVPALDFSVPISEVPQKVLDTIFPCTNTGACGRKWNSGVYKFIGNVTVDVTRDLMNAFVPAFKNKSTSERSYWSFKKMHDYSVGAQKLTQCATKLGELNGIVTTNSLTYSSGPPSFDEGSGTLIYKVSSPSFMSDGKTQASGTYDLVMKSALARCIYGFSDAPIKAEISVINEDGTNQVATTVVGENGGWLHLSAKGFHYSSPSLQVKLTQENSIAPAKTTPVINSKPSSTTISTNKKITITCTKGKVQKMVTATNPKCPAGFKKKI